MHGTLREVQRGLSERISPVQSSSPEPRYRRAACSPRKPQASALRWVSSGRRRRMDPSGATGAGLPPRPCPYTEARWMGSSASASAGIIQTCTHCPEILIASHYLTISHRSTLCTESQHAQPGRTLDAMPTSHISVWRCLYYGVVGLCRFSSQCSYYVPPCLFRH